MKTDQPWWSHDEYLQGSGQGPRRAAPIRHPQGRSPAASVPGVLTDYRGAPCPGVRFRRSTYAGVVLVMAACLTVAYLLLHFNHA